MTRLVSKASLVNLAGVAVIALTCGAWGVANGFAQEPQAKEIPPYDLKTAKKPRSEAAVVQPPGLTACASGTATACRAIESGMAGGLWTWKDGNVTAMDDWETQAARGGGASMTLKFKPEPKRRTVAPSAAPSAEAVQRVLTACDGGDASACAAFAASVQPVAAARDGRTYTGGRRG